MKKKFSALMAGLLAVLLLLGACRANSALPQTITASDNKIQIDVPESWSKYEAESKDNLVLAVQDGVSAFAQIFWFPDVTDKKLTAKDYASEAAKYYGDDVQGSLKSLKVTPDRTAYFFAYTKESVDEQGNVTVYQGYEFFMPLTGGIAEVDAFYRYPSEEPPTNDQLLELLSIAETVRIK